MHIEAVVSGTLNYIFSTLSAENSFSNTIAKAKDLGYSEPDPRIDLSGTDVIRKLVILARESGYSLNIEDVKLNPLLPQELFNGSVNQFLQSVSALDKPMEMKRKEAESRNHKLRFVAEYSNGNANVGLKEVDSSHPFYFLEDSNNCVLITTDRYKNFPMEIKGYGAGAEVTAAGVFADIISIANIR